MYTKGPWVYPGYADHSDENNGIPYHEILDANGFEVVNQHGILRKADAPLIAAAPELLAVCQPIAHKMYDDSVGRTAVQAAQEAIAKALKGASRMDGISVQFRENLEAKRTAALRALREYSNLLAQLPEEDREEAANSRAGAVLNYAMEKIFGQALPLL